MAAPQITFYFDIGSPFSYLAFYVLKSSPVFATCQIEYVPVLLRDLFQKCRNPPPVLVENKFLWLQRERLYWARRFGVPVTESLPAGFPASTGDVQAVLAEIGSEDPALLLRVTDRLFELFWAQGDSDVVKSDRISSVLDELLGQEAEGIKNILQQPKSTSLEENTTRAFDAGAFGLPWFECTNTMGQKDGFWGIDQVGRIVEHLGLDANGSECFRGLL